jgi:glycerophosphoryl diester phosphodiesterase
MTRPVIRRTRARMAALPVALGAGALLAVVAAGEIASSAKAVVVAHRGGALLWPENSLLAFQEALALGVDALEFDLHLTADGEVVVIHDATLDRTTTGHGAVRDTTLTALATVHLRTRDGRVTEQLVPTLAQVLDLAAAAPVELLPEIKVGADRQRYAGIEEKVLALLRARGLLGRATVQAFQPETIRRLRALEPTARTMFLVSQSQVQRAGAAPADVVEWARAAGASDLGVDHRILNASLAAAARSAGLRLSVWTVNEEVDIRRVLDVGVAMVMSDRPDLVRRLLGFEGPGR